MAGSKKNDGDDGHKSIPTSRAGRFARVARMAGGVAGGMLAEGTRQLRAGKRPSARDMLMTPANARRVADQLATMRGAAMKVGQILSMDTGEFLPRELADILARLRSDAKYMPPQQLHKTMTDAYGEDWEQLFYGFDNKPLAAASIGQVHKTVSPDGREIVLKVQYPGVAEAIVADLRNADLLGAVLRQGFGGLDPAEMVDEIKLRIAEETDYELEARNQQQFAEYYRDHPFIKIPDVVPRLSTRCVLTTELVEGFGWSELMQRDQAVRDRAGEVIFRFVFRSLYRMGAFNGDPHPGNYLFHDDGTVTFLDFGLVKHFTSEEMSTFGSMVKAAAVDHDDVEFRSILEGAGMLQPDAPVSTEAVGEYFSHFYDTVRTDADMTWTREYANSIVRHTFDRTSPISQYATVPRAFVFIQRINLGLYALLGELHASGNYRRIAAELWPFVDAEPSTDFGRAEAAWLATHP